MLSNGEAAEDLLQFIVDQSPGPFDSQVMQQLLADASKSESCTEVSLAFLEEVEVD